jgi:putative nucleotidyltransferase with HDIG domain
LVEFNYLNSNQYVSGLGSAIKVNSFGNRIYFGQISSQDTFENNSVTSLYNEKIIKDLIKKNPHINKLLAQNKIPYKLNLEELNDLKENHCKDTAEICTQITKNLPPALKAQVNLKDLKDGAMLHDFGKVLIPSEILNKDGPLTNNEQQIMKLHSELGYQILKNANLNENILNLVQNHHNPLAGTQKGHLPDINLQIINLADKYSALTEKRVYKDAFSPRKALTILYGEVKNGKIDPFVFNALVKAVQPDISPLRVKNC